MNRSIVMVTLVVPGYDEAIAVLFRPGARGSVQFGHADH